MIEFLQESKLYLGFTFEVLAAFAGFLYLKKSPYVSPEIKFFILYLFYIVLAEFYTFIPIYAWVHDYEVLSFYENSVFRRSQWLGNINVIVYGICFSQIFIRNLRNMKLRAYLIIFLYVFVVGSILRHMTSGDFFNSTDIYIRVVQTFFVVICIGLNYLELLRSESVLYFHRDIKFYISVGVVLWSLCVFPLDIYDDFFTLENPYFIQVDTIVKGYANVFLYSVYTLGFYMDYRYKRKALRV
ncbi:hypothetical protein [Gramella sp. KN1008]|uniref:hypothetical protein n=1 Tax=Gramella sp. KN1008 TaxID=2529298 RepID=UPI00103947FE|nr:hypothetical protein [Gramella sp. KN1008]TBW26693.1 hypothetical protein EZJ28_13760 [Gramella sp. KN1008]